MGSRPKTSAPSAAVLGAAALAENKPVPESRTGRRRAVVKAVKTVAEHLGHTPKVSRSSYLDPRLVERFEDGETINANLSRHGVLKELDRKQRDDEGPMRGVEEAVIDLVDPNREGSGYAR
jgi:DNA topoisomerase IB